MITRVKKIFDTYTSEIIGAIICLGGGMLSGYIAHSGDSSWYQALEKPSFNPPSWIFSPVWTILYIMIGIAFGKIWNNRHKQGYLTALFIAQITWNFLWSSLFFGIHRIDLALYDICILWINICIILIATRKQRTIFMLLLPYFLWVSFATILNFKIYQLNPNSSKALRFTTNKSL